jgi:hypothetical protein
MIYNDDITLRKPFSPAPVSSLALRPWRAKKRVMKLRFATLLLLLTASAFAKAPTARPKSVRIVDVPSQRRDYGTNIGNIKVRFSDGHSEVWTSLGRCMDAHASPNGLIGWTRYTDRNYQQQPVNDTLRVRFLNGRIKDFLACPNGPFIEEWAFVANDSAVVIKSRGRHGPAYYIKYNLQTGKVMESVEGFPQYEQLPKWAQPFADDRPNDSEKDI